MRLGTNPNITDKFKRISREKQLKLTPQRIAVYEAIADLDTHPSADDVYRIVIKHHHTISFDTVNRTLLTFAEHGIIDIVESPSGVRRFDSDTNLHHHIHCRRCGRIIDFNHKEYDRLVVPRKMQKEYKISTYRVTLSGTCVPCQLAEKISEKTGQQ